MIIKKNKEQFRSYLEDTANIDGQADILYIPQTEKEIIKVLKESSLKKKPITFSGAGTGTTGGRVPLGGGILSLEKFDKILGIDKKNKLIRAQVGVPLDSLEKELNKEKLTIRASPTEPLAYLGGAISTCASGPKSFKYSSIRDYVEYLTVILSDGTVLEIKRGEIFAKGKKFDFNSAGKKFKFSLPGYNSPNVKSSAGYYVKKDMDLIDLFIGSEGTLGCITEAVLKVQDLPLDYFDCIVFFDSEEDGLSFVEEIKSLKKQGSFYPCAVEFFDGNSLRFLKDDYSFLPKANCAVYLEQEIEDLDEQDKILDYWCSLIEKHSASLDNCWFAEDAKNRQKIYEFRHKLPERINEFLKKYQQQKAATDIAVPDKHLREMYYFYQKLARESDIDYVNFGHIGQNHLHFNFLPKTEEESFKVKGYIIEFIEKAISLGGTVSAEHGIGKIKKPYLKIMYGEESLNQMADLKKVFDPCCILNLDNIFPRELLKKKEVRR